MIVCPTRQCNAEEDIATELVAAAFGVTLGGGPFVALTATEPTGVRAASLVRYEIDAFVLNKLELARSSRLFGYIGTLDQTQFIEFRVGPDERLHADSEASGESTRG